MKDIIAVDRLPVGQAVRSLSYPLEKLFLQHAGRRLLKHRKHGKRRKTRARQLQTGAAQREIAAAAPADGQGARPQSESARPQIRFA
jgi:hypothetical protein